MHTMDTIALSARLGWMPSYPQFDRKPLDVADDAAAAGQEVSAYVAERLRDRTLTFAIEDPDAPRTGRAASRCGGRTCWAPRGRATSTSSSTCSEPTTT
jgi:hypothetical protein